MIPATASRGVRSIMSGRCNSGVIHHHHQKQLQRRLVLNTTTAPRAAAAAAAAAAARWRLLLLRGGVGANNHPWFSTATADAAGASRYYYSYCSSLHPQRRQQRQRQQHVRSLHATAMALHSADASSSSSAPPPPQGGEPTSIMPPIQWTTHRLSPESIEKTDRIFHKILWLNFVETSELTACVNQRLKLVLTPKQEQQLLKAVDTFDRDFAGVSADTSQGGESAGADEAAAAAPVLVDVKLQAFDAKSKIKVIKEVRALTELGLKEAKELVEAAPTVLLKGLKPEAAEEIKAKLEAAGAEVELA